MTDDPMLQYMKSIDDRMGRMETAITTAFTNHQNDDDKKHEDFDVRLKSLETSRTAARAGMAALALGGTGGAAKLGFLDKIISMINGSPT